MSSHTAPTLDSPAAKRQRTQAPSDSIAFAASVDSAAAPSSAAAAAASAGTVAQAVDDVKAEQAKTAPQDTFGFEVDELDEDDLLPVSEWSAAERQRRADADAQELHDAGVRPTQLAPLLRELFNGAAYPLPFMPAELADLIVEYSLPPADAARPVVALQLEVTTNVFPPPSGYRKSLSMRSSTQHLIFRYEADARAHVQTYFSANTVEADDASSGLAEQSLDSLVETLNRQHSARMSRSIQVKRLRA